MDQAELLVGAERNSTIEVVEAVRNHPFTFGFRHPIITGKAELFTPNDGINWKIKFPAPKPEDPIWYGNCVQDVLVSAAAIRNQASHDATVTIQEIGSKGIGNSPWNPYHYRLLVEDQSAEPTVMEYVDHSPFHTKYINAGNTGVHNWVDITTDQETSLTQKHEPEVETNLAVFAYDEFDIQGTRGLSYVSLFHGTNPKDFRILFDFVMPGLPSDQTDYRIWLDMNYGSLNKELLKGRVERGDFVYTTGHPGDDKEGRSKENRAKAKESFPKELDPILKQWFTEMIDALPDEIPQPAFQAPGVIDRAKKHATDFFSRI